MALICGTDTIRNVIAFPKASSGVDLMVGSPSSISQQALKEYNISIA
jgi:aspartyl-tRNA synthetase